MQLDYEIDQEAIGRRLRTQRKLKRWTQAELSEYLGVTTKYVSKVENGDSLPSLQYMLKFAELTGASLDYLLRGTLPDQPSGMKAASTLEMAAGGLNSKQRRIFEEAAVMLAEVLTRHQG